MSGLIFIDSNVLIDLSQPGSTWFEWSLSALRDAMARGRPVLNAIVVAEIGVRFRSFAGLSAALTDYRIEDIPLEAAFLAGKAHLAYRRRGGQREAILPDFLIGAHCVVRGHTLLTRDPRRMIDAFPTLSVIAPPRT
jgi:predicted nucleic acid-binding protein